MHLSSPRDLESEARRRLPAEVYDFIAGGAEDELTLRSNESAFTNISLIPRVLRGTGKPNLAVDLLGCHTSMPVFISPTAFHRLVHSEGERATARAASAAGTIMIVSMASTVAVEEIAAAAREQTHGRPVTLWFQLYIQDDMDFTLAVVRRAEKAGCSALVISVDSPTFGCRERDLRHGFHDLPQGLYCENMREVLPDGRLGSPRDIAFSADISWKHIDCLRKTTTLPLVLKGILHPADALLAVQHGADAVFVSNHGGRQLDTVPAPINVLSEIARAVGGRVPVFLDGGIRRGTDVVKSIAFGASAVGIGRPVLWGLATGGEERVSRVLENLRSEIERTLILCGCRSICDLSPDLVRLHAEESCLL